MPEICQKCGLPKDLCVCEDIARETQRIKVYVERRKYGKHMTCVTGFNEKDIDLKALAKQLKDKCACGGTAKNGVIELQGDHRSKVKGKLIELGYAEEMIEAQ